MIFKEAEGKGRGGDREGLFGACTHTQLDICFTEDDVYSPVSSEVVRFFCCFFVFWRPSHVAHLAFTLLQAHSATQSGSTDSLVHVLGTLTGQEVIGTSHKNAQKIARRSRKQITDKCPAVFVIVFWGGMLMLMSAEGGRGQCALPA